MLERILVPLDTSKVAEQVLPYATLLAKELKQPIILYAVVADLAAGEPIHPSDNNYEASLADLMQQRRQYAQDYLNSVKERLVSEGVTATTEVATGDIASNIVAAAATHGSGVIAMATHGRVGPERWFMGSIADKVIRTSPVPVLLIRPKEGNVPASSITHILLPLDGSEQSDVAMPYAAFLAKSLSLPVTVIQTVPSTSFTSAGADLYGTEAVPTPEMTQLVEDRVKEYLDSVANKLRESGITADSAFSFLPTESELEEQAKSKPGAIIVMSTHGRSGIGRALLGSVADRVIRSSMAPVLVIRTES